MSDKREPCYFCGINLILNEPKEIIVDGKQFLACEKCLPNVFRTLDTLKVMYKTEVQKQVLKMNEDFVARKVSEQIKGRYTEGAIE